MGNDAGGGGVGCCHSPSFGFRPSFLPSFRPSARPPARPSVLPSLHPSVLPSFHPSILPPFRASVLPSFRAALLPSCLPDPSSNSTTKQPPSYHRVLSGQVFSDLMQSPMIVPVKRLRDHMVNQERRVGYLAVGGFHWFFLKRGTTKEHDDTWRLRC